MSYIKQFDRRANGFILVDGVEVASTATCSHCNSVFMLVKGSGTTRGFCTKCMKITCGSPGCDVCVVFERKLDLYEKGKIITL